MDRIVMKNLIIVIAVICYLPLGCASLTEKAKMEQFGRTLDAYEAAMRISDLNAVCHFVNPAEMSRQDCLKRFGNIRMADSRVTDTQVSKDRMKVHQEIEVSYYFLDRYVLKKMRYRQTWQYLKDRDEWLLQNGPPVFK
jgi:hypothetical protein